MSTLYEKLLRDILEFRAANADATLHQQRAFARGKLENEYQQERMTFGVASRIDNAVFGFEDNGYWAEAYGNPDEGQSIRRETDGEDTFTGTAFNCGIFTIKIRR